MHQQEEESDDGSSIPHGIDFPNDVSVNEFVSTKKFGLTVDVDSLYFGHEDLGKVVAGLGAKSIFSLNWMIDRRSCTNQSRFSVTTRNIDKEVLPLRVHGKKPLNVALHRFRNVTLFTARIPNFNNSEIRIHLYWLYSTKLPIFHNYFSDIQLISICFLLNKSRIQALNDASLQLEYNRQYHELSHVPMLSHHLAGKAGHFFSNKSFQLSYEAMCLWADAFDVELFESKRSNFTDFLNDFEEHSSLGTYFVNEKSKISLLKKVHEFFGLLYSGHHFTATMAGAKADFLNVTDSEFEIEIDAIGECPPSDLSSEPESSGIPSRGGGQSSDRIIEKLHALQTKAYSRLMSSLDIVETRNRLGNTFYPTLYYIDFGVEIVPSHASEDSFLLLAEKSKVFVENCLKLTFGASDETDSIPSEIANVHQGEITLDGEDQQYLDVLSSFCELDLPDEDVMSVIETDLEGKSSCFVVFLIRESLFCFLESNFMAI